MGVSDAAQHTRRLLRAGGSGRVREKLRSLVKILAINLAILAVGIVSLELYFGNWFRTNLFGILCDGRVLFSPEGLYERNGKIVYERDRQCLRGPYNPASIDVITVGGSTVDQRYLSEGETWQDAIKASFEAAGRNISIANAGMDGQSTIGNMRNFEVWFPKLDSQPKYYLFYIGLNDLYTLEHNGPLDTAVDTMVQQPDSVWRVIRKKSALHQLWITVRGLKRAYEAKAGHRGISFAAHRYTDIGRITDFDFYREYLQAQFVPRLELLRQSAARLGSRAIFVTQRSIAWKVRDGTVLGVEETHATGGIAVNGVDRHHMEKMMATAIMDYCRERNLACLDVFGEVAFTEADFYDFTHNTPAGARKLGAHMAGRLLQILK